MPSIGSFLRTASVLVVSIGIAIGILIKLRQREYLPWHQTAQWNAFLDLYDQTAKEQYRTCTSHFLPTSFGPTHVYSCDEHEHHRGVRSSASPSPSSSSKKKPMFLFHGAGSNALIYGGWLVPPILNETNYKAHVIEFVCDVGRSSPREGNPDTCPATAEELTQWVEELSKQLLGMDSQEPITMLGYSYGTTIAFLTALHKPELVDKLILLAPASIFAPISPSYMWRAVLYYLTRTKLTTNWFFRYMSVDPNFALETSMAERDRLQVEYIRNVGGTILAVPAETFDDDVLQQVLHRHSTLLIVGEEETVNNGTLAAERAKHNGAARVKLYPNAGHLMIMEYPAHDDVVEDVVSFLQEES